MIESFESHRSALFGLCYRMTGSAADAEDVVQETFERALRSPPPDQSAPLRPWLVKVASNLCIDTLRRRQRESYRGPWLPGPVETPLLVEGLEPTPEARYGALESATHAFLLALEALDPKQRAVLVLRDVVGMSGPEVAAALELSAENVRVILHRARKALEGRSFAPPDAARRARIEALLQRFMLALASGEQEPLVELLAEDVRSVQDAGGDYIAAVRELRGRDDVVRFHRGIGRHSSVATWLALRDYNGVPSVAVEFAPRGPKYARRFVLQIELDDTDRIVEIRVVLATRKLHAVAFPAAT